jgi:hypothetical protein
MRWTVGSPSTRAEPARSSSISAAEVAVATVAEAAPAAGAAGAAAAAAPAFDLKNEQQAPLATRIRFATA